MSFTISSLFSLHKPEERRFWDKVPEKLMTDETDGDGDGSEFINRHTHNDCSNGMTLQAYWLLIVK